MRSDFKELVSECIRHQNEMVSITPILRDFNPSWQPEWELLTMTDHPSGGKILLRKRLKETEGLEKMRSEYISHERGLRKKMTRLAEVLEEEEFEVERFKKHLSPDQFTWLLSQKGRIKKYLRGIELKSWR